MQIIQCLPSPLLTGKGSGEAFLATGGLPDEEAEERDGVWGAGGGKGSPQVPTTRQLAPLPKLGQTKPLLVNCTGDNGVTQWHFKLLQLAKICYRGQAE